MKDVRVPAQLMRAMAAEAEAAREARAKVISTDLGYFLRIEVMMIIIMVVVKMMNINGHCVACESVMEIIINQLCQQLIMNISNDDVNQ